MQLHRQRECATVLRRRLPAPRRGELDALEADTRELHWRCRAILGGSDGGLGDGPTRDALFELAGLNEAAPTGRATRERALQDLERALAGTAETAQQCRARFPGGLYDDEFRLAAELAAALPALDALRARAARA